MEVGSPSTTIQFVDTVYEVRNGIPFGGGNYLATPPCRYEDDQGVKRDTFLGGSGGSALAVYFVHPGWDPGGVSSTHKYGGAWAWHRDRANVIYTDGHAEAVTIQQLGRGCDVDRNWNGNINDLEAYRWAVRF